MTAVFFFVFPSTILEIRLAGVVEHGGSIAMRLTSKILRYAQDDSVFEIGLDILDFETGLNISAFEVGPIIS
jgi:hypothetical protein